MKYIAILAISLLAGCSTLGLQGMTADQIKASAGIATCSSYDSLVYGKASFIAMNVDDTRKGATSTNDTTIACGEATMTVKATAGVPVPPGATTTTVTTVTPAQPLINPAIK